MILNNNFEIKSQCWDKSQNYNIKYHNYEVKRYNYDIRGRNDDILIHKCEKKSCYIIKFTITYKCAYKIWYSRI